MTNLDPVADKVVRDAVDAYLDGYWSPQLASERRGETAFETTNSRYQLVDGVVVAAPDDSSIGSELVGWLVESARSSAVELAWQPGSRAVLVDRHRGRNIIVTSMTRLLHLGDPPRRPAEPAFFPRSAPVLLVTPPAHRSPEPPFAPARAPLPTASELGQRRSSAVHLPPRPIASAATRVPASPPVSSPVPQAPSSFRGAPPSSSGVTARPQSPFGAAPPSSSGVTARPQQSYAPQPVDDDAWQVTSSEIVLEEPPPSVPDPGGPTTDPPIPLVRPVDPLRYEAGAPPRVPRPRR